MTRRGYTHALPPAAGGFRCPLNDLVQFNNGRHGKFIEVRISHRELVNPDDAGWESTDLIAKFATYQWALDFAKDAACHRYAWAGGVLIR